MNAKKYGCRVAFQVLIDPNSYKVGKETLGYGSKPIDTEFDNSEIEWSTKEYGTTILYGLLIKAEEIGPLVCPYRQICQRFLKTLSLPGNLISICAFLCFDVPLVFQLIKVIYGQKLTASYPCR